MKSAEYAPTKYIWLIQSRISAGGKAVEIPLVLLRGKDSSNAKEMKEIHRSMRTVVIMAGNTKNYGVERHWWTATVVVVAPNP